MLLFSAIGNTEAWATNLRMSRPAAGLARMPTLRRFPGEVMCEHYRLPEPDSQRCSVEAPQDPPLSLAFARARLSANQGTGKGKGKGKKALSRDRRSSGESASQDQRGGGDPGAEIEHGGIAKVGPEKTSDQRHDYGGDMVHGDPHGQ